MRCSINTIIQCGTCVSWKVTLSVPLPVIVLVQGPAKIVEAVGVVERGRFGHVSLLPVDPELLRQLCDNVRVLAHRQDILLCDWDDVLVDEFLPGLVKGLAGQVAPDPLAPVPGAVAVAIFNV